MATKKLEEFQIKTAEEIRDDILRDRKNSYKKRTGIDIVTKGSDHEIDVTSVSNQIYLATQSFEIKANDQMPDSAQGEALYRQAAIYGLALRAAGGSVGEAIFSAGIATPILVAQGAQLRDASGLVYQVTTGGTYSDGDLIEVEALDTGEATNLDAGELLTWVSAPAFANSAMTVNAGLTGGTEAETDENLRSRLLDIYKNPPGGGNWSQLVLQAENSTTAVQKCFAFPACNGPSTVHLAVAGAPTKTNKTRQISNTVIANKITPAVSSVMPEYAELLITSVVDYPVSISLGLSIPDAVTSSIPGPGGGWIDAQPFPTFVSAGFTGCTFVTDTDSTHIRIQSDLPPVAGTSSMVWIRTSDWTVYRSVVQSYTIAGANLFDCVLTEPFPGIQAGDWIFPDAENIDSYIDSLLSVFAGLGCGEKTDSATLLPRAFRRPLKSQSWSSDFGLIQLKFIENTGDEVFNVTYLYRSVLGGITPLPTNVTDGPYIFTPLNIGFYPNP